MMTAADEVAGRLGRDPGIAMDGLVGMMTDGSADVPDVAGRCTTPAWPMPPGFDDTGRRCMRRRMAGEMTGLLRRDPDGGPAVIRTVASMLLMMDDMHRRMYAAHGASVPMVLRTESSPAFSDMIRAGFMPPPADAGTAAELMMVSLLTRGMEIFHDACSPMPMPVLAAPPDRPAARRAFLEIPKAWIMLDDARRRGAGVLSDRYGPAVTIGPDLGQCVSLAYAMESGLPADPAVFDMLTAVACGGCVSPSLFDALHPAPAGEAAEVMTVARSVAAPRAVPAGGPRPDRMMEGLMRWRASGGHAEPSDRTLLRMLGIYADSKSMVSETGWRWAPGYDGSARSVEAAAFGRAVGEVASAWDGDRALPAMLDLYLRLSAVLDRVDDVEVGLMRSRSALPGGHVAGLLREALDPGMTPEMAAETLSCLWRPGDR